MADTSTVAIRDPESLRRQLVAWVEERVREAGLRGAVIGLSGGIDSAVVCGLAAEALGPERCLGLLLPIESAAEDVRLGRAVAERFGVPAVEVDLNTPFQALFRTLTERRERVEALAGGAGDPDSMTAPVVSETAEGLARANLKPRLRMITLYYYANLLGYMVLGTGNRAERLVGYFTKWGDGAADAFPLADLVKQEVRAVARALGVPEEVVTRPPTAGLWAGQTDEAELGLRYEQLDRFLLTGSAGDAAADEKIRRREAASRHKLESPPVAKPE